MYRRLDSNLSKEDVLIPIREEADELDEPISVEAISDSGEADPLPEDSPVGRMVGFTEGGEAVISDRSSDSEEEDKRRGSLLEAIKSKLTLKKNELYSSEEEEDDEDDDSINPLRGFLKSIAKTPSVTEIIDVEVDGAVAAVEPAEDTSRRSSLAVALARGLRRGGARTAKKTSIPTARYWITDTFRKRECKTFVRREEEGERCRCGLLRDEHRYRVTEAKITTPWHYRRNTLLMYTDAYGQIDFVNSHLDTLPNYLRLDVDTPPGYIMELLLTKWLLKKPNLVISIYGDSFSDFKLAPHAKYPIQKLKSGLLKAAETTNAWFFTAGLKCGVGMLIGKAMAEKRSFINPIPTIGIAPWGGISNRESLVSPSGCFPAPYTITRNWRKVRSTSLVQLPLEPNHTHFLLYDKGVYNTCFQSDLARARIKLEELIRGPQILRDTEFVGIMIGGDLSSLRETRWRVEARIPVVIMKGTGKMADVICSTFSQMETTKKDPAVLRQSWYGEKLSDGAVAVALTALRKSWPRFHDTSFIKQIMDLKYLFRNQQHLTICDLNEEQIDQVILAGLIRCMEDDQGGRQASTGPIRQLSHTVMLQLKLAITWNRRDLVEDVILKDVNIRDVLNVSQINELFYLAIEINRVFFVRYLLISGTSVFRFLDRGTIVDMLNDVRRDTVFYRLLKEQKKRKSVKVTVMRGLGNCIGCKTRRRQRFKLHHFEKMIYKISDGVYKCAIFRRSDSSVHRARSDSVWSTHYSLSGAAFEDPYTILVLFCVLQQKHEMAKAFWEYSKCPTMLALIASHLYYWLASKEGSYIEITPEMKPELKKMGDEFQNLAYLMIDEAARNYSGLWVELLLTHTYFSFGARDLLQIADYVGAYHFISHDAVQSYITRVWMGMLEPDMKYWKILLTVAFPYLACFRKRTVNDMERKAKVTEEDELEIKKKIFIGEKGRIDDQKEIKKQLTFFEKVRFYYSAPVVKFFIYLLLYTGFLLFYCNALLIRSSSIDKKELHYQNNLLSKYHLAPYGARMSLDELIVYVWVLSIIPVEIRQIHHMCPSTVMGKLKNYMATVHNKIDVMSLLCIIMALFFKYVNLDVHEELSRLGFDKDDMERIFHGSQLSLKFEEAMFRFFFTLAFCGLCLRLAQAMQIHPKLGPKVLMMLNMFVDLMFFVGLLVMALFCYGVATQSLIYPNKKELSFDLVFNVIWRPYVNMFGELDLDGLTGDINEGYCEYSQKYNRSITCSTARTSYDCSADSYCYANKIIVLVMLGVYMMLVAVMMLNLLVAVFTFTYDQINSNSDKIWKYQRFDLVQEFKMRSAFPIPFNTIILLFLFVRWAYRQTLGREDEEARRDAMKMRDIHKSDKIALLEAECKRNVLANLKQNSEITIVGDNVAKCTDNVQRLTEAFKDLKDSMQSVLNNSYNQGGVGSGPIAMAARATSLDTMKCKPDVTTTDCNEPPPPAVYPGTDIQRYPVTALNQNWDSVLLEYDPPFFAGSRTTPDATGLDDAYNTGELRSYVREYEVRDGMPLNPLGRTGIRGKGALARCGPNHQVVVVISRFSGSSAAFEVLASGDRGSCRLPVLETNYSRPLEAINGEVIDFGTKTSKLEAFIGQQAFLSAVIHDGELNTDNAWVERIAFSLHDRGGDLESSKVAPGYGWVKVEDVEFGGKYFQALVRAARTMYDSSFYLKFSK